MKNKIKKIILKLPLSVQVYMFFKKLYFVPSFLGDFIRFKSAAKDGRFELSIFNLFPQLTDKTKKTNFEPHYTFHPAWAARIVKKINPVVHIDVSSTLAFSTIVSAFLPVKFYDYRPAFLNLEGLESEAADLNKLPFPDASVKSLSCMHVIEHIGLGRYGDKIDPGGDIRATNELKRVTAPQGSLIIIVPVGRPRIEFNAHRIYSYEQIMDNFKDFELKEFSLVPDDFRETGMIFNADPELVKEQDWGCGCFWFIKK